MTRQIIDELWQRSPVWLKDAYHNSPVIHQQMCACASANNSYDQMFECVCHALLSRNYDLETQLFQMAASNPPNDPKLRHGERKGGAK